jgi:hypothetical protein
MNTDWILTDTEQAAKEHPDTFPTSNERLGLSPGDFVKVSFESLKGNWATERMWVIITQVHATGKFEGKIDNEALNPNLPRLGEPIQFEAKHILSIIKGLHSQQGWLDDH